MSCLIKPFVVLTSFLLIVAPANADNYKKLTERNYKKYSNSMAVLLVNIEWSRWWSCGQLEYAQLKKLNFTLLEDSLVPITAKPSIMFKGGGLTSSIPKFYQVIVEPGEYALTSFSVGVSSAFMKGGRAEFDEEQLVENGAPVGGTFRVDAGEIVYIGDFYLDCHKHPIPWRYYLTKNDGFPEFISNIRQKYPFIGDKNIEFRLFDSEHFAQPYFVPEEQESEEPGDML